MCDATGLAQFMRAVGEIARGAPAPSVPPVWQRELLCAKYHHVVQPSTNNNHDDEPVKKPHYHGYGTQMAHRSFLFGPSQIETIRKLAPQHPPGQDKQYTTFELLTSCLWRCCALAFQVEPNEEVPIFIAVNTVLNSIPPYQLDTMAMRLWM